MQWLAAQSKTAYFLIIINHSYLAAVILGESRIEQ
jgi:uncharacterized membrane protein YozB (DUF420 family)